MKLAKYALGALVLLLLAGGLFGLEREKRSLKKTGAELRAELDALVEDRARLEKRAASLEDPMTLLKEARSEFNYKAPDEHLIILVPPASGTGAR